MAPQERAPAIRSRLDRSSQSRSSITTTTTKSTHSAANQENKTRAKANKKMLTHKEKTQKLLVLATLALILNALLKPGEASLKVTVAIPELVKIHDGFWLNCSHDSPHKLASLATSSQDPTNVEQQQQQPNSNSNLNSPTANQFQQIYSIKWYKDEEEFYSFLPNGDPKVSHYETAGVKPDKEKSFEGNVFIAKADLNSEGTYRCEILSEGPIFETVRKSKHLVVFALPVRGPRIEILDADGKAKNPRAQEIAYEVGDKIELRCNSAPSKPAARLRWYLNDREIPMPAPAHEQGRTAQPVRTNLGYKVHVTPVEHRVQYKGIFTSHSTLSLMLERDDLVNSRISFKCLASIRQEVPVYSKQLVVLTPQQSSSPTAARTRSRRTTAGAASELAADGALSSSSASHRPRHRAQYNNKPQSSMLQSSKRISSMADGELLGNLVEETRSQMMYIYEDADTTLGPSIIDGPETLERYLSSLVSNDSHHQSRPHSNSYALEFNRADNLDYVQQMKERQARQRQIPTGLAIGGHKRLGHGGFHALVKSPFYLDENDPYRPIVNWPPLDSGKLILLPPSHSIVAIPTRYGPPAQHQGQARAHEIKFVMPPRPDLPAGAAASLIDATHAERQPDMPNPNELSRMILERLIENLNCTCTEGNADTKLKWLMNDRDLNERDVRYYPTRISPDYRQTWVSIGLQPQASARVHNSLASILSQYYRVMEAQARSMHQHAGQQQAALRSRAGPETDFGQQVPVGNEQLKFMCQAQHAMLLYSSSEMITFDFNPPAPSNELDGPGDKFSSLPSNVIQAATASTATRSKSSATPSWTCRSSPKVLSFGSHSILAALLISFSTLLYIAPQGPFSSDHHTAALSYR